jgi:hypothetical protein
VSETFSAQPPTIARATPPTWLLPLLAVTCFASALGNEAIGDDIPILQRLQGIDPASLWTLFCENYWGGERHVGLYRPLSLSALAIQKWLFGTESMLGFHLVSLALHVGCTLTLRRLLSRVAGEPTAWWAAALFAVHPIHVEAVVTAYGQCDLLAAFFGLLALERGYPAAKKQLSTSRSLASCVCCLLALLSKESAIVVPALGFLYAALLYRDKRSGLRRWVGSTELGFAAVTAIYLGLRFGVLGGFFVPSESSVMGGAGGLKVPIVTLGTYVRLLVAPTGQTIFYGHSRDALTGYAWSEVLWLGGAVLLTAYTLRRRPGPAFTLGIGWLAIAILPVSNIIPIGVVAAERALYLPSMGFALLSALAFEFIARRFDARIAVASCVALILIYLGVSARVTWHWRTPYSLWESTVKAHPTSPKAHAGYGIEILERVRIEKSAGLEEEIQRAESEFRRALSLNEHSADARIGLAIIAIMKRDCPTAIAELQHAQRQRPADPDITKLMQECQ